MKPTEITRRVEEIARKLDDPERAHGMEDALRLDFIKYVALDVTVPVAVRRKAKQIIDVSKWDYPRNC